MPATWTVLHVLKASMHPQPSCQRWQASGNAFCNALTIRYCGLLQRTSPYTTRCNFMSKHLLHIQADLSQVQYAHSCATCSCHRGGRRCRGRAQGIANGLTAATTAVRRRASRTSVHGGGAGVAASVHRPSPPSSSSTVQDFPTKHRCIATKSARTQATAQSNPNQICRWGPAFNMVP